jgi:hypothetical protein
MENSKISREHYISIMKNCLEAWSQADVELVASFYCDDLDYRDPSVPQGIRTKTEFVKYLKLLFKIWPIQNWVLNNAYPHENDGAFSVDYTFQIANDKAAIRGRGIDRTEFKGDRICLNHVYLNADKWNDWVINELKSK